MNQTIREKILARIRKVLHDWGYCNSTEWADRYELQGNLRYLDGGKQLFRAIVHGLPEETRGEALTYLARIHKVLQGNVPKMGWYDYFSKVFGYNQAKDFGLWFVETFFPCE